MVTRQLIDKLSIIAIFLLSRACTIDADKASKDSMKFCIGAQEILYESTALRKSFKKMLVSYNETCFSDELCSLSFHDDMKEVVEGMDNSSTLADLTIIKGRGAAHFGGAFYEHENFKQYAVACEDAGGMIMCIDAAVELEGLAGETFLGESKGFETDIKLDVTSYPVCMTKACVNEDLTSILENSAKNALLKSPKVARLLGTSEAMVKAATVEQVCALSGLDVCEFEVVHQKCGLKNPRGAGEIIISASVLMIFAASAVFLSGTFLYTKGSLKRN